MKLKIRLSLIIIERLICYKRIGYNAFKKIGSVITALTSNECVVMLKDIFRNVDEKIPVFDQDDFTRGSERTYCCPDYFEFKKDYFMWGDKYARTMFIKDLPASLKDMLLTDITNTNLDVMVSVNIAPVHPFFLPGNRIGDHKVFFFKYYQPSMLILLNLILPWRDPGTR